MRRKARVADVSAYLCRPMCRPSGSIGRFGEPGIFHPRLRVEAALADDEGAVDLGVLLGLDAVLRLRPFLRIGLKSGLRPVALGASCGAHCTRGPGTRLIGILAGAVPGIARRLEGGVGG